MHARHRRSELWGLQCEQINHVSIENGCYGSCRAEHQREPSASDGTFCKSAIACFKFLDRSLFPCRRVSCFFWSRRRMM